MLWIWFIWFHLSTPCSLRFAKRNFITPQQSLYWHFRNLFVATITQCFLPCFTIVGCLILDFRFDFHLIMWYYWLSIRFKRFQYVIRAIIYIDFYRMAAIKEKTLQLQQNAPFMHANAVCSIKCGLEWLKVRINLTRSRNRFWTGSNLCLTIDPRSEGCEKVLPNSRAINTNRR